ncbi:putative ATPase N2B [Folsomia candida]|uniref:Putative ATPase N2B n=1 Tax=Folsomia candida TaxID=158441 RepID=A0A226E343_FOLCA|nr:putative ATPase N2B [Folsomia candida]
MSNPNLQFRSISKLKQFSLLILNSSSSTLTTCPKCLGLSVISGKHHLIRIRCLSTTSLSRVEYRLPSEIYAERVRSKQIDDDKYQAEVIKAFDKLQGEISTYKPPPKRTAMVKMFQGIFGGSSSQGGGGGVDKSGKKRIPSGLYIWGSVGGGKTMLMDLFFDVAPVRRKLRVHFHSFMSDVHTRIHRVKQATVSNVDTGTKPKVYDPIPPVAEEIAETTWLLCFDEFQVTDIGDAMVLKRLFTELFNHGVVVVATSNRPPDDLYKNGLQRSNFLPFIKILKDHCDVISLESGIDYRRKGGSQSHAYFISEKCDADAEMDSLFKFLSSKENDTVRPKILTIKGRNVTFEKTCGQVVDCTFDELCDRANAFRSFHQKSNPRLQDA